MLLEADRQHTLVAQKSAAPTVASVVVEFPDRRARHGDQRRGDLHEAASSSAARRRRRRAADKLPPSAAAAPAEQPLPPAAAGAAAAEAAAGSPTRRWSAATPGSRRRTRACSPAGRRSRSTASPSRAASGAIDDAIEALHENAPRCGRGGRGDGAEPPAARRRSRGLPKAKVKARPAKPGGADPAAGAEAAAAPAAGAVTIEFRVPRAVAHAELRRPRDYSFDEEGAALAEMEGFDAELEPSRGGRAGMSARTGRSLLAANGEDPARADGHAPDDAAGASRPGEPRRHGRPRRARRRAARAQARAGTEKGLRGEDARLSYEIAGLAAQPGGAAASAAAARRGRPLPARRGALARPAHCYGGLSQRCRRAPNDRGAGSCLRPQVHVQVRTPAQYTARPRPPKTPRAAVRAARSTRPARPGRGWGACASWR